MLTPKQQARLRTVAFVAIAFWMFYGPIHSQVLGGDYRIFRSWIMFSLQGIYLFDVSFYTSDSQKNLTRIDHQNVLNYENRDVERFTRMESVLNVGERLCATLGSDADVRIIARQATTTGWYVRLNGNEKICEHPL